MHPPPSVSSFVERAIASARVPGCSIAVVSPTETIWSGGWGWSDIRLGRRASSDTVYHLFSGTKLFTAVAVLQLAERGRLSLDDSVSSFLPDLPQLSSVTLRDLLSHRSGLRDSLRGFLAVSLAPQSIPSTAEALARYRIRSARPPGQRVEYRNVNYALLGEVITRVSGLEYVEYVARSVLAPLGMEASFGLTDAMRPLAARGYVARWDPMRVLLWALFPALRGRLYGKRVDDLVELQEYDLVSSAIGGLAGSVVDFGAFLRAQLTGQVPGLSEASTQLMKAMVARGAAGIESRVGVGLGWKLGEVAGRRFLNHEGGGAGFTSELRLYPDARIGIALAMNAMQMPGTMRLAHRICESVYAAHRELA